MYYEETVINGVLHIRTTPNGAWIKLTAEQITAMYVELRQQYEPDTSLMDDD